MKNLVCVITILLAVCSALSLEPDIVNKHGYEDLQYQPANDQQDFSANLKNRQKANTILHVLDQVDFQATSDQSYKEDDKCTQDLKEKWADCEQWFKTLKSHIQTYVISDLSVLTNQETSFLKDSGIFPGFIGRYKTCISNDEMKYGTATIILINKLNGGATPMQTGVCWPDKICPIPVWNACSPTNLPKIPPESGYSYIQYIETRDSFKEEFGIGGYIWFGIFFFFLIVVMLCTALNKWLEQKQQRELEKLLNDYSIGSVVGKRGDMQIITDDPDLRSTEEKRMAEESDTENYYDLQKREHEIQTQKATMLKKISACKTILDGFDIRKNTLAMIKSTRLSPGTQVFELLRMISMFWIIWAHSYLFDFGFYSKDIPIGIKGFFTQMKTSWVGTIVQSGFYAVDFFLFMGGYVSILALNKLYSSFKHSPYWKHPLIYIFTIVKRYMRIMPCQAFVNLFDMSLVHSFAYGPNPVHTPRCDISKFLKSFNQLSINNFQKGDFMKNAMCQGHIWYLVVDFQLYLTVPFIIIVHMFNKKAAILLTSLFILSSIIWSQYQIDINKQALPSKIDMYYDRWEQRGCVYWAGCLLAQLSLKPMYAESRIETNNTQQQESDPMVQEFLQKQSELLGYDLKPQITLETRHRNYNSRKKKLIITAFIGFVGLVLVCLDTWILHYYFQVGVDPAKQWMNDLFTVFGKLVFVVGMMVFTLQLCTVYKEFGPWIANNAIIQFIGALSFNGYLWHMMWVIGRNQSQDDKTYSSNYQLFGNLFGNLTITIPFAYAACMLIELPTATLWKVMCEGPFLKCFKNDKKKDKGEILLNQSENPGKL